MGANLNFKKMVLLLLLIIGGLQSAFCQSSDVSLEASETQTLQSPPSALLSNDSAFAAQAQLLDNGGIKTGVSNAGVIEEDDFLGDDFFIAPGEESLLDNTAQKDLTTPAKNNENAAPLNSASGTGIKDSLVVHKASVTETELNPIKTPLGPTDEVTTLGVVDTVTKGPAAVIEDARSINFAHNLKEYRSPKLAMLLSFIIPGAGQAYARNVAKTALFAAAELGVVGASVAFWIQGNRKSAKSLDYADSHFNTDKFAAYYKELGDSLLVWTNNNSKEVRSRLLTYYSLPHQNDDYVYIDTFKVWASERSSDFYDQIGDNQFVHGWLDAEPSLSQIAGAYRNLSENDNQLIVGGRVYPLEPGFVADSTSDSSFLLWVPDPKRKDKYILGQGYSSYQFTYNQMDSDAQSSYKTGQRILLLLLLNHIGSAIDAGLTAKRHNDELLGKQSVWRRLEFEQLWVCSGSQMAPGYAVRVAF